jgi:2'-5' RNA ligase
VDVEGETEPLQRLQTQVEKEIAPLGYPSEKRGFSPHLTLARVPPERSREVAPALQRAVAGTPPPAAEIRVREVALMKSDLQRTGAVYTQLYTAALA